MDILFAILLLLMLPVGIALIKENDKALQIFYTVIISLITIAIFLSMSTDSPKQFTNVFLTTNYAIMIPITINAQLLALNIVNYFKPKQTIKLTPLRFINLSLYANLALIVVMALDNNIFL